MNDDDYVPSEPVTASSPSKSVSRRNFLTWEIILLFLSLIALVIGVVGIILAEEKPSISDVFSQIAGVYGVVKAASTVSVLSAESSTTEETETEESLSAVSTTIDGVQINIGDNVLLKNETNPRNNGIYTLTLAGYVRASIMSQAAQITTGNPVYVLEGKVNGGATLSVFPLSEGTGTPDPITNHGLGYSNSNAVSLGITAQKATTGYLASFDPTESSSLKWIPPGSGSVTSISASGGLSVEGGGSITSSGTLQLTPIAASSFLVNNSASLASPANVVTMPTTSVLIADSTGLIKGLGSGSPHSVLMLNSDATAISWGSISGSGTVSRVNPGTGIATSPSDGIVGSGSVSLAGIDAFSVLGNNTAGSNVTPTSVDFSTVGSLFCRSGSSFILLPPASANQFLSWSGSQVAWTQSTVMSVAATTNLGITIAGTAQAPTIGLTLTPNGVICGNSTGSAATSVALSQGYLLTNIGGLGVNSLAPGTAGQFLKSQGSAADLKWATAVSSITGSLGITVTNGTTAAPALSLSVITGASLLANTFAASTVPTALTMTQGSILTGTGASPTTTLKVLTPPSSNILGSLLAVTSVSSGSEIGWIGGGSSGQVLVFSSVPTWTTLSTIAVTSITAGTGITVSGGTTPTVGLTTIPALTFLCNTTNATGAVGNLAVTRGGILSGVGSSTLVQNIPLAGGSGALLSSNGSDITWFTGPTTAGTTLISTASGTMSWLSAGTANQVLQIDSSTFLPTWKTIGSGTGTLTSIATGTGLTGGTITTSGTISLTIPVDSIWHGPHTTGAPVSLPITTGTLITNDGSGISLVTAGTTGQVLRGVTSGAPVFGSVPAVTSLVAGLGLSGGTITSTGTIALSIAANSMWYGNASAVTTALPLTTGTLISCTSSGISLVSAGTSGQLLVATTGSAPSFQTVTMVTSVTGSTYITVTGTATPTISLSTIAGLSFLCNTAASTGAVSALAVTRGGILTGFGSSTTIQNVTLGGAGALLSSNGSDLTWFTGPTTAGTTLISTASGTISWLAAGTSNQVLQIDSGTLLPTWKTIGTGTGTLTSIATGTGLTGGTITTSGTISLTIPVDSIWHGPHTTGVPVSLPITTGTLITNDGSGVALVAAGTTGQVLLGVTSGKPIFGSVPAVTNLVAGLGLSGGTITSTGTIALSIAANSMWYGNASAVTTALPLTTGTLISCTSSGISLVSAGTSGQLLVATTGNAPSFQTVTMVTSVVAGSFISVSGTTTPTVSLANIAALSLLANTANATGAVSALTLTRGGLISGVGSTTALQNVALAGGAGAILSSNGSDITWLTGPTTAGTTLISTASGTISWLTAGTSNQVLQIDSSTLLPTWKTVGPGTGTITSIATGVGLSGGTITSSGTISLTIPVDSVWHGPHTTGAPVSLPITTGTLITNDGSGVALVAAGTTGQVLLGVTGSAPVFGAIPAVTSLIAGTGLSGGTITSTGTIALSFSANSIWYGNASAVATSLPLTTGTLISCTSSGISLVAAGTSGQVLIGVTSGAPVFGSVPAVTSVATGVGLTGGPITSTGTISMFMNPDAMWYGYHNTGVPTSLTLTTGTMITHNGSTISLVAAGSTGQVLTAVNNGAPTFQNVPAVTSISGINGITASPNPITSTGTVGLTGISPSSVMCNTYTTNQVPSGFTLGRGTLLTGTGSPTSLINSVYAGVSGNTAGALLITNTGPELLWLAPGNVNKILGISTISGNALPAWIPIVRPTYQVVVDASGAGDYLLVSTALDAGATSIFIRNGTYNDVAWNITASNISILGESMDGVIINWAITAATNVVYIRPFVSPAVARYTSGSSLAFVANSNALTGIGTFFTQMLANDYLFTSGGVLVIQTVSSDTSLTVTQNFLGTTTGVSSSANESFFATSAVSNIILSNFTCSSTGSFTPTFYAYGVVNLNISNVTSQSRILFNLLKLYGSTFNNVTVTGSVLGDGTGSITVTDCFFTLFSNVNTYQSASHGIQVSSSNTGKTAMGIKFSGCNSSNNSGSGFRLNNLGTGSSGIIEPVLFENCTASSNGQYGLGILGGKAIVNTCSFSSHPSFTWPGIYVNEGSNIGSVVNSCTFYNNLIGIFLVSDSNVLSNCMLNSNFLDGFTIGCVQVQGSYNTISNNQIQGGANMMYFKGTPAFNTVVGNVLSSFGTPTAYYNLKWDGASANTNLFASNIFSGAVTAVTSNTGYVSSTNVPNI